MWALIRKSKGPLSVLAMTKKEMDATVAPATTVAAVARGSATSSIAPEGTLDRSLTGGGSRVDGESTAPPPIHGGKDTGPVGALETDVEGSRSNRDLETKTPWAALLSRTQQQALFGRKASPTIVARSSHFAPRRDTPYDVLILDARSCHACSSTSVGAMVRMLRRRGGGDYPPRGACLSGVYLGGFSGSHL